MSMDQGRGSALLLLYLSAAFDTVDHGILKDHLRHSCGVDGVAHDWFISYLSRRSQSVSVGGASSASSNLAFGAAQGSVLGPICFVIYEIPLYHFVSSTNVDMHQFSDDTKYRIDFQFSPDAVQQREALSSLADCATVTEDWFTQNRVKTNMDKSILMYVSSTRSSSQFESLPLQVDDNVLAPSLVALNLSFSIDSTLSMIPQVKDVCRKAIFQLRRIGKVRKYLTKAAAKSLIQALVLSNFDYAINALLFGLQNELLERLEKIKRLAARLVVGAKKNDRITSHMKALHWLPLRQRIVFKLMVLTYRFLNGTAPRYLSSLVSRCHPLRSLRSATSGKLNVPNIKSDRYGGRSFSRAAPVLWNELPLSVTYATDLKSFKTSLKLICFV
ncbi:uncharacterized protein LOC124323802 [Daphnia pulicaria]|uniref:uncharacterized protein LOC124323802 n=1 Tax=Daphnia pulicaria TaxID=35523 RepID=UPI001EECE501|nr:uncharacterized protein LOC124323802 [Daphnia pulicaria]